MWDPGDGGYVTAVCGLTARADTPTTYRTVSSGVVFERVDFGRRKPQRGGSDNVAYLMRLAESDAYGCDTWIAQRPGNGDFGWGSALTGADRAQSFDHRQRPTEHRSLKTVVPAPHELR